MTSGGPVPEQIRHTTSADGTTIGWRQFGAGPALVIVHGSLATGAEWRAVADILAEKHTIYLVDRRGRGLSTSAPDDAADVTYDVATEAADVRAVLAEAGPDAALLGHSYGALISATAVAAGAEVSALALYEPPLPLAEPVDRGEVLGRLRKALAANDGDRALSIVLQDLVRVNETEYTAIRHSPMWTSMAVVTPTFERELRGLDGHHDKLGPLTTIRTRTLFLRGTESGRRHIDGRDFLAKHLPDLATAEFPGHGHYAHVADPAAVAAAVSSFLGS